MAETQVQLQAAHHPGIFKRIISRVRHNNDTHLQHGQYHVDDDFSHGAGRRTSSFKSSFRGNTSSLTRTGSATSTRHKRKVSNATRAGASVNYPAPNPRVHTEAPLSRELWEEAYDSLRLDPNTSNLVVTYESIVSKELPDDLRMAAHSSLTPPDGDMDRRMELMNAIVSAKTNKRRGSKASQTSEMPRVVLEHSQKTIEAVWDEFPSAALAWGGLCTLTPVSNTRAFPSFLFSLLFLLLHFTNAVSLQLLIDPILRQEEFYKGMVHIIGRIPWYMNLTHLLRCPLWRDADDFEKHQEEFRARREHCREAILNLYRRVLEFEMNCVCATASAWNSVARHTVRWNGLGELNEQIREADALVRDLVCKHVVETTRQTKMLSLDVDLDVEALERERDRELSMEERDQQQQQQQT